MKISNVLNPKVNTISVDGTIEEALEVMTSMKINGMPVVDGDNKLVGMIVKSDIYRFLIQPGHYDSCPVEWVMSKVVITVEANEDVLLVAKRLRDNNIVAMPILENDKVVGIISIEDLLDYYIGLNSQS